MTFVQLCWLGLISGYLSVFLFLFGVLCIAFAAIWRVGNDRGLSGKAGGPEKR